MACEQARCCVQVLRRDDACWHLHCWYIALNKCVLSLSCRFDLLLRPATTSYLFPVREQFQSPVSSDRAVIAAANHGSQGLSTAGSRLNAHKAAHVFGLRCCQQKHKTDVLGFVHVQGTCFPSWHVSETLEFQTAVSLRCAPSMHATPGSNDPTIQDYIPLSCR